MPCLDEAETLGDCIDEAQAFLIRSGITGEVLIADNGSTDGSQAIARVRHARVVDVSRRGYGAALAVGVAAARGRFVVMGDADGSYDFANLMPFLERLRAGADIVMGNRFQGGIEPGAMPWLHRYVGNPVLSFIGRLFFHVPAGDFHCGLRGVRRDAIAALDLRTTGMEYASEMLVVGALNKLAIAEVPTTLRPDGRSRPPHLRTWRDGWRHLRFLLIYSPRWLFFYPGLAMLSAGILLTLLLLPGPAEIMPGVRLDIHTLLAANVAVILGLQSIIFGVVARRFAEASGQIPSSVRFARVLKAASLERVFLLGVLVLIAGFTGAIVAVARWTETGFGALEYQASMRVFVPSTTAIIAGFQLTSCAFLLGIAGMAHTNGKGT
ncbi:MAG: glycosyltransferase family 2 protein [Alphaproteobacteria bacterium]|nr:glycosyltransferase family 2 protein [Alphaproteobacteria bacterium]